MAEQNAENVGPALRKSGIVRKVLLAIAILVAAFLGYVALQPSDYRITRSATMTAPPAAVFEQVNDFHKWEAWSPWAKKDPNAKNSFEGPASGTGAVFKWSGNDEVGEGSMTLTESQPNELIRLRLDFVKPFEDTANTEFTFKPEGDKTRVTWTMSGKNNFIGRIICTFMNMDKMVGGDFEQGLANMKSVVETASTK
jgi:uncharacterized protein YndB with AHSA1/START domain